MLLALIHSPRMGSLTWMLHELPAAHFHMLVEPEAVAQAVLALAAPMAGLAAVAS